MTREPTTTQAPTSAATAWRTRFAFMLALTIGSLHSPPAQARVHPGGDALEPTAAADGIPSASKDSQEQAAKEGDGSASEGAEEHATAQTETSSAVSDTITVVGIRADDEVPITKTDLDREQIERLSFGQDLPQLIEYTPSVTWYSDSGIGSNYSYFSLRGIQQSRINMTFDGAPLNDPAEHVLYFNNFHDFSNAVDSIQIQRGVGTSSVGAPSYGGSVNFASPPPAESHGGDARFVIGSYDTLRASIAYESGLTRRGLYASGRLSLAETDGYRDNSGSEHRTFYLNAGWQGQRSSLKFVSFSGTEESQLAFLAVEPEILEVDRTFNPLDQDERDNFGQDFAQLKYTRALRDDTLVTASLYYNGADGWFRLWDDPVAQNDLLQFGIDQYFIGSTITASKTTDRLSATFGLNFNDFQGDHTLDIGGDRIYLNTGFKQTADGFAKAEYQIDRWLLYGDLQLRWAEFDYDGDVDLDPVAWTFFDPKIGIRRAISERMSVYASIGLAQREPTRMDLLLGEDNASVPHDFEAVRPEEVVDLEVGVNLSTPDFSLDANIYAMEFTNEIALTGELSEIGLPLRTNVDDSYRRGVEIDLEWRWSEHWTLRHSANLSRNRIKEWTQFYDVFDDSGDFIDTQPITYKDVPPLLSPEAILNLGVEWSRGATSVGLVGRYVSAAHLDNTGLDEFELPSYTNLDLRASVDLSRWWSAGNPSLTLFVDNLLDNRDQYPSGYSYQYLVEDNAGRTTLDGIPFYYPLATRNAVLALAFKL